MHVTGLWCGLVKNITIKRKTNLHFLSIFPDLGMISLYYFTLPLTKDTSEKKAWLKYLIMLKKLLISSLLLIFQTAKGQHLLLESTGVRSNAICAFGDQN